MHITVEIASSGELESIREELIQKGFKQTPEDDVMSTIAVGWAPANPWFSQGFTQREVLEISDQKIQILPLPYFIASKFSAHNSRGGKDPRTSHDFEDIVYVIDNRTDIVEF